MEIIKNDDYEEVAATYQCLEIGRLNEILKNSGIEDKELREKICTEFIFTTGQFLDSGWFVSEETRYYPELSFAERSLDPEEGLGETERLHVPSDGFAFHEYAHGDIEWYFEEHEESTDEIEHGIL